MNPSSDYPTATTPIKTIGLREICEVNGRHFRRIRGTTQWIEYQESQKGKDPTTSGSAEGSTTTVLQDVTKEPLYLSLVQEKQNPGEPLHWSLLVAPEGQKGSVYQVTGDAEFMRYEPNVASDVLNSDSFFNIYHLAEVDEVQAGIVQETAEKETPPRAPSRAAVTENCQGWAVRVIGKLVQKGIVAEDKLEMAKSMLQPV